MGHRDKGQCVIEAGRSLKSVTFVDKNDITSFFFFSILLGQCKCSFTISEEWVKL